MEEPMLIERKKMVKSLANIKKVIKPNKYIPILNAIKFEKDNNKIMATNLDIVYEETYTNLDINCAVMIESLTKVCKAVSEQFLKIERADNGRLVVNNKYPLEEDSFEDMPVFEPKDWNGSNKVVITKSMLEYVNKASKDNNSSRRYNPLGILFDTDNTVVGANSYRMHTGVYFLNQNNEQILLSNIYVDAILSLSKFEDIEIYKIKINEQEYAYSTIGHDNACIFSPLLTTKFPNYKVIISNPSLYSIINYVELDNILNKFIPFCGKMDDSLPIRLTFSPELLTITLIQPDVDTPITEQLNAVSNVEKEETIGINPFYLRDAITNLFTKGEKVKLEIIDNSHPVFISNNNMQAFIMPMRL